MLTLAYYETVSSSRDDVHYMSDGANSIKITVETISLKVCGCLMFPYSPMLQPEEDQRKCLSDLNSVQIRSYIILYFMAHNFFFFFSVIAHQCFWLIK